HTVRRRRRRDGLAAPLLPLPRRGRGPARRREPRRHDSGGGRALVRALLSVSDKRGIVELARELVALGWEIVSTGGTAEALRSAAKNHQDVIVVVDPDDYPVVLAGLKAKDVSPELRHTLAAKVFAHTAAYDATIYNYLVKDRPGWPERITLALERHQELRYGENPHQAAALYAADEPGIRDLKQLHGKELSFNNLLDVDAALAAVAPWSGSDRV